MSVTLDPINLIVIIPQAERRESWKGVKLTRQGSAFKMERREIDPGTRRLLRELAKQEAQHKADVREARRERARELRDRRKLRQGGRA